MTDFTARDANIANWICTAFTIAILLARIAGNRYQLGRSDAITWVVLLSLVVFLTRVACNHVILMYGTVGGYRSAMAAAHNTTDYISTGGFDNDSDLAHAQIGSQLTLVARILITSFYWLQCTLLLLLYRRILAHIPWVSHAIRLTWVVIGTTYLAVILSTVLECRPITLYWQVSPDPGHCTRAYIQLLIQCLSNIAIDLMLLAISLPILRAQARAWPHNLQLGGMFVLGTFCIIITVVRVKYVYAAASAQNARSFWASVQAVVAVFVANLPSVYGAVMLVIRRRYGNSRGTSRGTGYDVMDEGARSRNGSRVKTGEDGDLEFVTCVRWEEEIQKGTGKTRVVP